MRRLLPDPADLAPDEVGAAYRLPPGRALRINFIASLDGATTVAGRSRGLQSPGDLVVFRVLRALADVVLVGAGTAAAEGYGPMTDDSVVGRMRVELGRPATAPIAVVSRRASLEPGSRLAVPPTILVTCAAADAGRRAALADAGVQVLVCGEDDVDLPAALDALAERGLTHVTCEGGPQLLRTALEAGVVDELDLSISPALVGGEVRLLGDVPLADVVRLDLRQVLEEDGMLFTRYGVRRAAG
ncbi:dihydrofolate reductase family protein [Geodermatophilus sp. SYSU D00691]